MAPGRLTQAWSERAHTLGGWGRWAVSGERPILSASASRPTAAMAKVTGQPARPDRGQRQAVQAEVDREIVEHHPEGQPLGEVEERYPGELPPRPHRRASVTWRRVGSKHPFRWASVVC